MNKTTSMVLVAAVAGIMVAATLAVTMTQSASALRIIARGGDGGVTGAGGAGGNAFGGGNNAVNVFSDNSARANGGDSGNANGGEAQNCLAFSCHN